jgi:hypothetical protein
MVDPWKPDGRNVIYIRLGQPEISAVAKHGFEQDITSNISSISILDKATGYMDRVKKEATEMKLRPSNFNGDGGFTLSRPWYTVTNMVKQYRDTNLEGEAK